MRADVNLSVREVGAEQFGTRTEMKNLNSFKAIARAIEGERARQIELIEEGRQVIQETRRWDDNKEYSYPMRSKEDAQDYRYFPEPDLVPIMISAVLGMVGSAFRYPPCYAVMLLVIALYLFLNVNCVYLVVIGAVCGLLGPLLSSVLPPPLPELEAFRLTMTVTEADAVPLETTMEVAPVPTAVMTPLALTVATLVSLDLKVRDWEAEDGVTLPVMVRLAPGLRTT